MNNTLEQQSNVKRLSVPLIKNLLLYFGFKTHHLGTLYLLDTLTSLDEHTTIAKTNFSTTIYPQIALRKNTTALGVQKAITSAIRCANYDEKLYQRMTNILHGTGLSQKYPPTPKEFVGIFVTGIFSLLQNKSECQILSELKRQTKTL